MIPVANPNMPVNAARATFLGSIYYYGSRMLEGCGKSIDDAVGYRVLDMDEEQEFRERCGNKYATIVCYYAKKQ